MLTARSMRSRGLLTTDSMFTFFLEGVLACMRFTRHVLMDVMNRAEAAEIKKLQKQAASHGPMGKQGGISKSGKKK